jgi:diguanylate cyclase (GGDEF)-like protein
VAFHWSIHQLTEYFAVVSASSDEEVAVRDAVERAVEALDAEVGGALLDNRAELVGLVGLTVRLPVPAIASVLDGASEVELPGLGPVHACYAPLGSSIDGGLFVARIDDALSAEERQMLQGMAQVLGLALRNLRALTVVRARQTLLETLLAIQRAISQREPLQSVLDAITQGASNLLGQVGVALVLTDPAEPTNLIMAANFRWPPPRTAAALAAATAAMRANEMFEYRDPEEPVSERGERTISNRRDRLAERGDHVVGVGSRSEATPRDLRAAPVHVGGSIAGSLVAMRPDSADHDSDRASLGAFAQQISMALTDAHTVEAMREAYRDSLTGLPNRALFLERLERSLNDRHHGPVVVLFIDLDRFKAVNDSLGHQAGDELLTEVAARLRETLRGTDLAARLGGDEFAVLLEGESADDACRVAERIAVRIAEPFRIADRTVYIGASVGVAQCEPTGAEAAELLSNADVAMYRAKKAGAGRVVVFEPAMHTEVVTQLDFQVDLNNALGAGQFRVDYQPVVRLDTRDLHGAEALLRWHHPTRGLIPPEDFVPVAEEIGLITEIGLWVLREAVTELAVLRRSRPDLAISANFSPREVMHDRFVAGVTDALTDAGLPGSALTVELTETALMTDSALALRHLGALKERGVRISLDDFGTGHSSLSYLRRFPVDQLKIDRAFVAGMCDSGEDRACVKAIIDLARGLRLDVVAEGIDDVDQLRDLVGMGCLRGQGDYLHRPMPAADLRLLVNAPREDEPLAQSVVSTRS